MMNLEQKRAVVTGGTGALGSAIVQILLAAGATVAVPSHREQDLDRLRDRLALPPHAALIGAQVDLTDEQAVNAYYNQVAQDCGGLDILVNVAGGFDGGKPVHESGWAIWQTQLDLNLKTAVLSCAAAVPHMMARGGGAIVNVGTRTATQPGARLAAYAASKRAILQLTEALAAELQPYRITANTILPSVIDTPANRSAMPNANYDAWVPPEAIARVVLFLVGPDARIISGAHVPVYGDA
ncbi:SDR family NAD(P)-dependent oxidoreductase [Candidatus Chloroploca asiatica]|nr:SDR family NAD(P)-dependent oxidoreductase [Candidatus Chloroploca asiatica]